MWASGISFVRQQQAPVRRGAIAMKYALAMLLVASSVAVCCGSESGKPSAAPSTATTAAMAIGADQTLHVPVTLTGWARGAMLFDGLGDYHRAITTTSPEAQKYFDQGLRFMWAFNHDEATRSFAKAAELDPKCAACFWGVSLTVGPNYNLPFMIEERAKVAWESLRKAQASLSNTAKSRGRKNDAAECKRARRTRRSQVGPEPSLNPLNRTPQSCRWR
jgi:hypothetical protein